MQNYSGCWRLYNLAQGMPTTKEIWQSKIVSRHMLKVGLQIQKLPEDHVKLK